MVGAAASAWLGGVLSWSSPWWVVIAALLGLSVVRRPAWLCLCLVLVTGVLADRSLDGLRPPPPGPFAGVVTLITDPEPALDGRLRFEAGTELGRVLAEVESVGAAAVSADRLAGDRLQVEGTISAFSRPSAWTRSRHLIGRLTVNDVTAVGSGAPPAAAANRFRRILDRGASSLPADRRALLAGLVLGDDRAQPPQITADFRAAGLTHLLAVSGQNVLLVLAVAGPVLRRFRIWPRFLLAVAVIAAFALTTRFEASVVRAAFVAGVALFARTIGRPSGGLRHLCIAVCLLLLIDPLLVHSLGFRLSVAASAGVLTIAPVLVGRLRGPRWFREGLGVTTGAQLAVAPVLVPVLGPMPLAALPANIAAGPLAGLLMVWGLTAGTIAGLAGGTVARVLHVPSGLGLWTLERVAAIGASLPLGVVDLRHIAAVALAAALASRVPVWGRVAAAGLLSVAVVAPVLTPLAQGEHPAGHDATVWVDGPMAVVDVGARASPVAVLDALRSRHVAAVGLVVVRSARPSTAAVVEAVESRFPVGAVIGPPGLAVPDLVVPPDGFRAVVGRLQVVVDRSGPPLRVRIGWARVGEGARR